MQEATKQITQCKKIITDLQGEIDQLQKQQRDANNKVVTPSDTMNNMLYHE